MRREKRLLLTESFIFCFLMAMFSVTAFGQTRQQIAQRAFPSVVLLVMEDENGQPISLGSGFFVHDCVIATNLHVVEDSARGYAKIVGRESKHDIEGIVGIDRMRDLVLLSVANVKIPSLPLGDNTQVAVGDEVYVIGNPQGLEGTFSQGIVSSIRKIGIDILLQITAPISPGSSGGPVLNSQGKVIGVAVATFKGGQNLNFAVPISYLSALLSNTKPVVPLSGEMRSAQGKSILDDLGGRSTEGVTGGSLVWEYETLQTGAYSFSLRNGLRESVKNVYCLVVFYDSDGAPIDIDLVRCREIIPAGLAKRVLSVVDGSIQKITTSWGSMNPSTKIEFRILDFQYLSSDTKPIQTNPVQPEEIVDPRNIVAIIQMMKGGQIVIELYPEDAPNTVANFIKLANKGFYNGLTFHRVVPGFVVQGGCPIGDGTGGPGYRLKAEFNSRKHLEGTVAMGRTTHPDSAGSQFYICLAPQPGLDGQYTVFGQVIEGMDVVERMKKGDIMKKVICADKALLKR